MPFFLPVRGAPSVFRSPYRGLCYLQGSATPSYQTHVLEARIDSYKASVRDRPREIGGPPWKQNPLDKLKLDAPDQRRERRLREGELTGLIEVASSRRNPLIAPIIRFALATAMRRGEILNVQWVHIDRAQWSLLIPRSRTGGNPRSPPFT